MKDIKPYSFPDMNSGQAVEEKMKSDAETVFTRIFQTEKEDLSGSQSFVGRALQPVKEHAKELEEQGYMEGFEKGEKEGLESAESRVEEFLNSLGQAVLGLKKVKKDLLLIAERETVNLALSVARKIVQKEIATDKGVVMNVVKKALKKVSNHKNIKIRLSPSDFDYMNEAKNQVPGLLDGFDEVIFEGDSSIGNGGCVIDTQFGEIDARVENQISTIEEMFREEIRKRGIGD